MKRSPRFLALGLVRYIPISVSSSSENLIFSGFSYSGWSGWGGWRARLRLRSQ